jgi:hypothetical protein
MPLGIARRFFRRPTTRDRHDLELPAPKFSQTRGSSLAQTVDGTIRQARRVTPFSETAAEARDRE